MKEFLKSLVVRILFAEAAILLRRHKPKVVAITGSVGKTSTKDAIFAAIKNNIYARKSEKSFNSEIGVPLTVLGLPNAWDNPFKWLKNIVDGLFMALFSRTYPEVLVLEAGVGEPGDMEKLAKWLNPDIVVMTRLPNVPVHVEYFATPQAVIDEKMRLVGYMKTDGVFIYNHDDEIIKSLLPEILQKRVGFSRYLDTDFTAREDKVVYKDDLPVGVTFKINHLETSHEVTIGNTIGTQHVYSSVAALAVADELSVPLSAAVESLCTLETPPGRMRIMPGIKSTLIIDDSYNSSPFACEQALQALKELSHVSRRIVVLGDMLELGKYSTDEHKRIGSLVPVAADILFTVGIRARHIAEGALSAGMSEKHVFQYDKVDRAGRELQSLLHIGDAVLIKASQGIRAERIVEEVMAEPEKAADLLVRQDSAWKQKKASI